jgi:hypothetical protein
VRREIYSVCWRVCGRVTLCERHPHLADDINARREAIKLAERARERNLAYRRKRTPWTTEETAALAYWHGVAVTHGLIGEERAGPTRLHGV